MNHPLAEQFRYNKWANLTLLEACRDLDESLLGKRLAGVSGSVGELLLHLVGAQQTFVLRTQGRQHEGELHRESAWPGIGPLIANVTSTSNVLIAIAEALEEDTDVNLPYGGDVYRFPKSFFLVHAFEHGVEHRTEIKVALNQVGIATPDLDAWAYASSVGYGSKV